MELKHINNIVLYAKNWYRKSGDLLKDCRLYVGLDHPKLDTSSMTLEQMCSLMREDYAKWVKSIGPEDNIRTDVERLDEEIDNTVNWENDEFLAKMWHWLIDYETYIPDLFSGLKHPVYDKERGILPQRNLILYNPFKKLPRDATDRQLTKVAEQYFSQSRMDVLNSCYMSAMRNLNVDNVVRELGAINPKYVENERRTSQWIIKLCKMLWIEAKKYLKINPDNLEYVTFRKDVMVLTMDPLIMNVELIFCPVYTEASIGEADVPADAPDSEKKKALFEKCVSKIDMCAFQKVLDEVYRHENYCAKADEIIKSYRDNIVDCPEEEYEGTWTYSGISVKMDPNDMVLHYNAEYGFGPHEDSLYNANSISYMPKY